MFYSLITLTFFVSSYELFIKCLTRWKAPVFLNCGVVVWFEWYRAHD